jgi:hypothetical protein
MNRPQHERIRSETCRFFNFPSVISAIWILSMNSFHVLAAVDLKIPFLWDTTLCQGLHWSRRFEGMYRLHHVSIQSHSKMKAAHSFKTPGCDYPVKQCHIPEEWNRQQLCFFSATSIRAFWKWNTSDRLHFKQWCCCLHMRSLYNKRREFVSKLRKDWLSFEYTLFKSCLYTMLRLDRNAWNFIVHSYQERDRSLKPCQSLRKVLCLSSKPHTLKELLLVLCPSVVAILGTLFRAGEWSSRTTGCSNVSASSETPNINLTMNVRVRLWPRILTYYFVIKLRLLPFVFHALSLLRQLHWCFKRRFAVLQSPSLTCKENFY